MCRVGIRTEMGSLPDDPTPYSARRDTEGFQMADSRDAIASFKNINGVYRLKEMFYETALNKDNVIYTLKQHDHEGFPSLYRLYLEAADPTKYKFAVDNLGGWTHWKQLTNCSWFQEYLTAWRDELEIKLRSEQLARILITAGNSTKDSFAAQKYVTNKEWDKVPATKGRPLKSDISAAAHDIASERSRLDEDLQRLVN